MKDVLSGRFANALTPAVGAVAFIFLWWLAAWLKLVDPVLLPSPQASAKAIWDGFVGGNLMKDLVITVRRTLLAFGIAVAVCVPLGLMLGSSVRLYRSFEFVIDFFRSTPASALFPLFLVILGVGESTKIAVAAFGAGLLILFNTAYGVMNARKTRQAAARVMGASPMRVMVGVTLLESLPQTFVGMRSGVSFALVIVIVAEMFIGSTDGLGQRVINAQMIFNMPEMYATIFGAGVLGYGLNLVFILIERRFIHWGGKINAPDAISKAAAGRQAPATHITIRGLTKSFAGHPLYTNFDLDIPRGQITSIFGPNGCGKSTMINMVAGLLPMDAGEALFDGKTLAQTVIGYVFQNYRDALFPWKRAIDNIKYPLRIAGKSKGECDARTEELVQSFDIRFDLNRYPYELSGGQQQLVSIMRSLAVHPEVLFLDEPFSALDYEMTLFMRDKLQDIFEATRTTMILVSHDLDEAVYLADQVLMLTRRPTRIAEVVRFDAPRPRHPETLTSDAFNRAKAQCLEVFQREVRTKDIAG